MNAPAADAARGDAGPVPGTVLPSAVPGTANRWRAAAACAGLDLSMFYTERTGTARAALAVCAACPVRAECLADALDAERQVSIQEIFGVRGGMSAIGRRKLLGAERTRAIRARVALCGTDSGYYRHRRERESPCDACKAAHAAAYVDRRRRRDRFKAVS